MHVKYPLFSSDFNQNLHFLDRFSENNQIPNFINTRPAVPCRRTDGQTDMTKPTVTFLNSANTL